MILTKCCSKQWAFEIITCAYLNIDFYYKFEKTYSFIKVLQNSLNVDDIILYLILPISYSDTHGHSKHIPSIER